MDVFLILNESERGLKGLLRRDTAQQGIKLSSQAKTTCGDRDRDDGAQIGVPA
jgi:hypothetical protein